MAMMGAHFRSPLWALLLFLPFAFSQASSFPTNDFDAPSGGIVEVYYLETTQFPLRRVPLLLLDLSRPGPDPPEVNITGNLRSVTSENFHYLGSGDIAYVSCDESANGGEIGVQEIVQKVTSNFPHPPATVLYSTVSNHCNYSAPPSPNRYRQVFSVLSPETARNILEGLGSSNSADGGSTRIGSNEPATTENGRPDSQTAWPDFDTGTGGTSGGGNGDSPSSSVAMIILYSVTGIITTLFLAVIVIGTIRAHRNPERYGPRNVAGRPRRSRARGLARAMLETLPIVKFGDSDDVRNEPKTDVEMASHDGEQENRIRPGSSQEGRKESGEEQIRDVIAQTQSSTLGHRETDEQLREREGSRVSGEMEEGQIGPAVVSPSRTPDPHESLGEGTLGCPICTDDFIKGQDVRLLPCDHKFHPECIDPWLVNVSGTCPLCRIDLAPAAAEEAERRASAGGGEEQQPPEHPAAPEPGGQNHRTSRNHRRLSEYLHDTFHPASRRDMTVEQRIDAVRRVRSAHSSQAERMGRGALILENPEEPSRRETLTARLRDRFRVRTRRHGEEPREESAEDGPGPSGTS